MSEQRIAVVDSKSLLALFGPRDQHLRKIRETLGVSISARDGQIHLSGDEGAVAQATQVLEGLQTLVNRFGTISTDDVANALNFATNGKSPAEAPLIEVLNPARKIRPKTPGQMNYVRAIQDHDVVFCAGPAGTGKTYLAVAMAVAALKQERIRKIVLVRPAVEAGEILGYLPGDMQAKINCGK
jgi:phosphate starvation-inducible PhoH-like protein